MSAASGTGSLGGCREVGPVKQGQSSDELSGEESRGGEGQEYRHVF